MNNHGQRATMRERTIWALTFALTLLSCSWLDRSDERLTRELANAIESRRADPNAELVLDQVTNFNSERVFLFPPYTPTSAITEALGFPWEGADRTGIATRDDIVLLVFVTGRRVVRFSEFPRSLGDFSEIEFGRGLSPADAKFRVELNGTGRTVIRLASTK